MSRRARPRGQGARPAPPRARDGRRSRAAIEPVNLSTDRARALQLVPVSRETLASLDNFLALLLKWQRSINLIAPSTIANLWTRHVADSLQLSALVPDARVWVDLGSGAGFPGLPIACALARAAGATVHLVESNAKKAAFLRAAARVTAAPTIVHAQRITDFAATFGGKPDVVTARALAPLTKLLEAAHPLLKRGAVGVFPKGQDVDAELTEAAKCWNIQARLEPSRTDPRGRIVIVEGLESRAVPKG
jgi:16S rRNA (guanine527-N7)-methyltransferase